MLHFHYYNLCVNLQLYNANIDQNSALKNLNVINLHSKDDKHFAAAFDWSEI